jgi:succinoglycan biosynthesis protein ExoA
MTEYLSKDAAGEVALPDGASVAMTTKGLRSWTPLVSIVMPVLNEEAYLRGTLEMLLDQEYPRAAMEILVVDGGSMDGTREIARAYERRGEPVRLVHNLRRWSSAARNRGVSRARGEIILVIDGHCELPDRRNLANLVRAFEKSDADIVGRPQPLIVRGASPLQQAIAWARACWLGHHPDSYIYCEVDQFVPALSVGAAYRRSVFDRIGYFDESFDACEDVDFNYRADQAGLSCYLAWQARVHYHPRHTLGGLFRQLARYGRGRVRLSRKHPRTWSWKSMAPAAGLATWLALLLASPWSASALTLFAAANAAYALVLLGTTCGIAMQRGWSRPVAWLPAVFATIHFAAGFGELVEGLAGWRRNAMNSPSSSEGDPAAVRGRS